MKTVADYSRNMQLLLKVQIGIIGKESELFVVTN